MDEKEMILSKEKTEGTVQAGKKAAGSGKKSKKAKETAFICEHVSFAAKEAYKRLRTNVLFSFADGESCHVIGVTSAAPSDGKSLTSLNFAYSLAEMKKKVLLIEADMRRPSQHIKLGMEQSPGLSNLLVSVNNIGTLLRKYTSSTDSTSMDVITAGDIPPNPAELLGSAKMKQLVGKQKEVYDYIIIDLPPVGAVTDAQHTSRITDGMLVVIHENSCPRELLDECIRQLQLAEARILGFVVNGTNDGTKGYGKKGYGYGYGYYK